MNEIKEDTGANFGRLIHDTFVRPAITMIAWGAFVHMTNLPLEWCLGFWPFFTLNLVCMLLTSTSPTRFIMKRK